MQETKKVFVSRAIHFLESKDQIVLRLSIITVFLVFGIAKWFEIEVQALEPLITKTWLNIFNYLFGLHGTSYFLGVVELATVMLLIAGFSNPALGAIGAALVVLTGLVTLSLLPQLRVFDSFIFKDVVIAAVGLTLLKRDLVRWQQQDING
jgi:uncharacterized membrane protein YkgB